MKKIYIVMAVLATVALASCQQEKSFNDEKLSENSVVFTISGGATRSAEAAPEVRQGVVIPLETEDGSKFFLEETVVNLNEIGPETKGTPAYTENLGTLYANDLSVYGDKGSFTTAATYQNMETSMYARKDASQGEGWRYQHNYNGDPWPKDGSAVGFYLNMPAAPTGVSITGRTGGKFTFTYTSPTTAAEQQDILFAYRSMTKDEHMGFLPNGAPVLFNHALTAVKFAIGNDLEKESVSINSVTFVGLKNKGTNIVMAPVGATEDDEAKEYTDNITNYTSAATVDWSSATADPTTNEISETYEGVTTYATGAGSFGTGKGNYPQSFSAAGNKNNLGSSDGSQIFWLIPQTFAATSEVKLRIAYTYGNNSGEWTIDFGNILGEKGVEWKAGELRTYTIKIDDVNVKIEDEVHMKGGDYTADTKNNIHITNTGNTDAFIRAAIVGQWLNNEGKPVFGFTDKKYNFYSVASWYQDQFVSTDAGTHGKFTDLAGYKTSNNPLNGWYLCTDGYYYYEHAIEPGKVTGYDNDGNYVEEKLFTSYEVGNAPKVTISGVNTDIHFSLEIATQAISANKTDGSHYSWQDAWEIATGTKPTIKTN